jgi:uncharacterized protein (DUF433 family)
MLQQVIHSDPDIQGGAPCFNGTRVPITSLFDALEHGRSLDYFLEQFPSVKREQATAVLHQAGRMIASQPRPSQPA